MKINITKKYIKLNSHWGMRGKGGVNSNIKISYFDFFFKKVDIMAVEIFESTLKNVLSSFRQEVSNHKS